MSILKIKEKNRKKICQNNMLKFLINLQEMKKVVHILLRRKQKLRGKILKFLKSMKKNQE